MSVWSMLLVDNEGLFIVWKCTVQRFNIVNGVVDVEKNIAAEVSETNPPAETDNPEGILICSST